jgi:hypothetical protein
VWAAGEYDSLRDYDGPTGTQATGLFQCHQNDAKSDQARLCAGWVACHGGEELLALRLAGAFGSMEPEEVLAAMQYETTVPVFDSGAEAAEHGKRDIDCPSPEAKRMVEKISNRRDDIVYG